MRTFYERRGLVGATPEECCPGLMMVRGATDRRNLLKEVNRITPAEALELQTAFIAKWGRPQPGRRRFWKGCGGEERLRRASELLRLIEAEVAREEYERDTGFYPGT